MQAKQIDVINKNRNENSQALAKEYIEKGVIPEKYEDDALHIAVASVNSLYVIVRWNFTHIGKLKTLREAENAEKKYVLSLRKASYAK